MGNSSTKDETEHEMEPGDLIKVIRKGYQHWAIVNSIENKDVWCYHITNLANNCSNTSPNPISTNAMIKREILDKIVIVLDKYFV